LDQPAAELTLTLSGEAEPVVLFFGAPLPDDPALAYVKRSDEPPLYAVPLAEVEALRVAPSSLRSRQLIDDPDGTPRQLELARGADTLTLTESDGRWVAGGTGATVHAEAVGDLLEALRALQLIAFVESPGPLASYGLEGHGEAGTITWSDEEHPQRIRIGKPVEGEAARYAYLEERQAVVTVPEELRSLLMTSEASLQEAPTN
jgi:hypothetical protein